MLCLLALFALTVLAGAPFVGGTQVSPRVLWDASDPGKVDILWKIRIPRVLMAFLAGTGLAISGMAFQAVFRNPLATPFTLGVSSGASLGAAVAIHSRLVFSIAGIPAVTWLAFAGAVLAIVLVYGLTRSRRGFSSGTMLLAGVAVSFFFSSILLLLQYLSDFTQTFLMLRWVMGGLDNVVRFHEILDVLPLVVAGSLVILYLTHDLNLLATGEELATARGVEVQRAKIVLFFACSLMVGGVVAVCGPIGFVGLMVPHICRLLVGPDHRWLTPATWLFGGAFLILCDTLARTVRFPTELPVGILTALLGGPFFLWLLLRRSADWDAV